MKSELDFEVVSSHEVEITATDGKFTSSPSKITVEVTNVNDAPPVMTVGALVVNADAKKGDIAGKVELQDEDG